MRKMKVPNILKNSPSWRYMAWHIGRPAPSALQESSASSPEHGAYLLSLKRQEQRVLLAQLGLAVGFFALWEAAARLGLIEAFIFSQPSRIVTAAWGLSQDGSLFSHMFSTLSSTLIAFGISTLGGIILATLLYSNAFIRRVAEPYLVILNSMPKTALAPVIIVIFGTNIRAVIVTAVLTSIIVTVMGVLQSFLEISEDKLRLVQSFGASPSQTLQKLVLPASMPAIFTALRINIGLSFIGVVVGEFLVANTGLGALIIHGSQVFRMDWVMLSIILLMLLAAALYKAIALLEARVHRMF